MHRRAFLAMGASCLLGTPRVLAQPEARLDVTYGESRLGLSDDERDATLYVPKRYKHGAPIPILVMLHGFAGSGDGSRHLFPLAEEFGVVILAPESRDITWGKARPGFDDDVHFLGPAYRHVAGILDLDTSRVALGGVSDGAGYALGMGLAYGDAFKHIMVFAGGLMRPFRRQGKPRLFFAHGVEDVQMPIEITTRRFVPQLKSEGYNVTYREYQGGHRVPPAEYRAAFEWFIHSGR
jgi:phospholipase/carboxylesterase